MRIEKWTETTAVGTVERTTTVLETAADVTEEILDMARGVVEGWYNDGPIDWEAVWDRMDSYTLEDGTTLFTGDESDNPAQRKIQRVIRAERRA